VVHSRIFLAAAVRKSISRLDETRRIQHNVFDRIQSDALRIIEKIWTISGDEVLIPVCFQLAVGSTSAASERVKSWQRQSHTWQLVGSGFGVKVLIVGDFAG